MVLGPTNTSHDVALLPSQTFMVHTLFMSLCGHAGRMPTGGPAIVTHMPAALAVLHAWHCPVHAEAQQTPSTQKAFIGHVLALVHVVPSGTVATTVTGTVSELLFESA